MMEFGAELIRMLLDPGSYQNWLHHGARVLFADLSQGMAAVLLTALWQGLVIAAFLGLCLRFAPRVSAGLRFVVLAGGFAAVVALPFLPALLRVLTRMMSQAEAAGAARGVAAGSHPWLVMDARWSVGLALFWIGISLWRATDLVVHTVRLRRLWKGAIPVANAAVVLPKLRGRKAVELCTTEELERPSVIGFLAPRILIPAWLLERMTEAELKQIVLHESEHLRRGDDWTNLLQKLSLVVFPLNPALAWIERRLCLEREMACDEGVVRRTQAPRAYAACLTNLAEHGLEQNRLQRRVQALSLGVWQRRSELARRVHSLLAHRPALRPAAAGGVVLALGCGLVVGSAELARCPQMIGFAAPSTSERQTRRLEERSALVASNAMEGDRVLRPEMRGRFAAVNGGGARATQLRAVVPAQNTALPLRHSAGIQVHEAREAKNDRFPAPTAAREQLLRAEMRDVSAELNARGDEPQDQAEPQGQAESQGRAESQGWVVLTTMWEQSEVTSAAPVSDSTEAEPVAEARPVERASHVTVTRLIWRVEPVHINAGTAGDGGDAKPAASEIKKLPPAIVPVRGGWLIFRL